MEGQIPNIEEINRNLKHQLDLYKRMLDLLREERQHIVSGKIKELRDATFAKEALIDELQKEEFRRESWMVEAAQIMRLPVGELTLKAIVSKYAPESFESYMSVQNTLIVLVRKCKELNEENKSLVEGALRDTQVMKKNVLGMTSEQPKVYGPKGNINQKENTSRILNKEA